MIAALVMIVVIQCLAVRDRKKNTRGEELEEAVVQTTTDDGGKGSDSKMLRAQVESGMEIEQDDDGRKL